MKNAILVSVAMLLFNVGALAHADSAIVAQVSSVDQTIKTVSLTKAGEVEVVLYDKSQAKLKLSSVNASDLLYQAEDLGQAQVVTDTRAVICQIFLPAYADQNLSVADANGTLKLVLSPSGCSFFQYTHPTVAYELQTAQSLEQQLITLARQLVND